MEIFRLLGTIAINNDQATKALADTSKNADKTTSDINAAFGKIGTAARTIGTALVTAGAVVGTAWIAAIESTREYRTEMGKLDTAFVSNGHSSQAATKTYKDLQAVLGDSAVSVEAANHLAVLTDNEKDLQTWTDICTGVFATFGDSLPIEGLTEAANETAKTGVVTGGLADALNWAGISEDEFNEKLAKCSSEQQRQDLIMNTLNGTYSKASKQYKETNKDVMDANRAQEKLTNAFAELGRVGEPILTAIKTKVSDMVTAAVPHIENFVNKVKDLKKWIKENEDTVDTWVAVIIGATVSIGTFLLILNWGKIMTAATNAIKGVRAAILLFNTALLANPIGLIVSLLAGLVAGFIYLWNNNKGFRDFWLAMWEKVKAVGASAIQNIKNKFNDLKAALTTVKNTFSGIKNAISERLDEARNKVKSVIDKIKGYFPLSIGKLFSNLKIPKITVSGGKAPFGIAGKGKLPSFSVKWNAEGGVLTKPTIFGQVGNTLLGGGEAGDEAIAPIDTLQTYIRDAVQSQDEAIIRTLIEQNRILMDFLARIMPSGVRLDSGALVGELVPAIDGKLSDRWRHAQRGNTR